MNICYITPELAPLAKVGGLADVAGGLPPVLARAGHDVRVFLPLYDTLEAKAADFDPVAAVQNVEVSLGTRTVTFSLYEIEVPSTGQTVFCVYCPEFYDRGSIYTSDEDEAERYVLLSRAAIESCQRLQWAPDVFHVNDWQTALVPLYLGTVYAWDQLFARSKTLLTIHNIGYQGVFPLSTLERIGLEAEQRFFDEEDIEAGRINFMRTGIRYTDRLTTVSPTYAREIQTSEYGMGLEVDLSRRASVLTGILNGVDYDAWHPSTDTLIPHRYSEKSLWRKGKNKEELLKDAGMVFDKGAPLVGMVSRLTAQKGIDLLIQALPDVLTARSFSLVVVGSGEERYEHFWSDLVRRFPSRVRFYRGYSNKLAHFVEAASDIFLMPSMYEPSGLNQMYSLRYGAVPVVRRTGGLADSVQQWDPQTRTGTGFVFEHYSAGGVHWALSEALDTFRDSKAWRQLMINGMRQDFSWEKQAEQYLDVYRLTVAPPEEAAAPSSTAVN